MASFHFSGVELYEQAPHKIAARLHFVMEPLRHWLYKFRNFFSLLNIMPGSSLSIEKPLYTIFWQRRDENLIFGNIAIDLVPLWSLSLANTRVLSLPSCSFCILFLFFCSCFRISSLYSYSFRIFSLIFCSSFSTFALFSCSSIRSFSLILSF